MISIPVVIPRAQQFVVRERWIAGLWASQRALFLLLTWLIQRFEQPYYLGGRVTVQSLLTPWTAWDSGGYRDIAEHGYASMTEAAFSPFYPFLIWLVHIPYSGLIVSSLAELAALYLLFDLMQRQFSPVIAHRVVLFLAWTPFAAIFAAAYSESVFLLCSVAVFWALQRERLLLAGLCAMLAALTRQYGILLCLPLLGAISWRRVAAIAMPVMSVAVFWVYVSVRLHTPFAPLVSVQGQYARHLTWPWMGLVNTITFNDGPHSFFLVQHTVVDLLLVIAAIILAVALRRYGWQYAAYTWATMFLVLCLPIATNTHTNIDALASTPRYIAVLFPLAIPLAQWASTPLRRRLVIWLSLLGVIYLATFLAAGIWIG